MAMAVITTLDGSGTVAAVDAVKWPKTIAPPAGDMETVVPPTPELRTVTSMKNPFVIWRNSPEVTVPLDKSNANGPPMPRGRVRCKGAGKSGPVKTRSVAVTSRSKMSPERKGHSR